MKCPEKCFHTKKVNLYIFFTIVDIHNYVYVYKRYNFALSAFPGTLKR